MNLPTFSNVQQFLKHSFHDSRIVKYLMSYSLTYSMQVYMTIFKVSNPLGISNLLPDFLPPRMSVPWEQGFLFVLFSAVSPGLGE